MTVSLLPFPRFAYLRSIFHYRDWARIAVVFGFFAVGIGAAAGAYMGFLHGFRFFRNDPYFASAATLYTLEVIFFIVALLVFASALLRGVSVLFASRENQFLLATPVSRAKLFASRFFENAATATWPVLLLVLPAVAAFTRVWGSTSMSLVLFFAALGMLLFLIVSLASLLDFLLVRAFRMVRGMGLAALACVLFIASAYGTGRILLPMNLNRIFYAESFEAAQAKTDLLLAHFRSLPTHALVRMLTEGYSHETIALAVYLLMATILGVLALFWFSRRLYLRLLAASFEGQYIARPEDRARLRAGFKKFPILLHGSFGAMLEKDIFGFLRSTRETSRALFLFFMLFLYLFLFRRFPARYPDFAPEVLSRILFFNLAAIGYFVTTLSLRFVFPLISLEGRAAWTTFASPVRRSAVLWEKFALGLGAILLVTVPLAALSAAMLGMQGMTIVAFLRPVIGMGVVLVAISLALGALFPNFRDRDPDTLSTTLPGICATLLSLGYVALAAFVGFQSIRAYIFEGIFFPSMLLALGLLNIVLLVALLSLAVRRIRALDI